MERIIHWIIALAIIAGIVGCAFQLLTTGSIQSPCC